MTEQLVGMEIDPSVIAIAEVEMAVHHQDLIVLQVLQCLLPDVINAAQLRLLLATCLRLTRVELSSGSLGAQSPEMVIAGLLKTVRPPTIVAATPPRSCQPSNGVFFDF